MTRGPRYLPPPRPAPHNEPRPKRERRAAARPSEEFEEFAAAYFAATSLFSST
jgi:hypothetical protein